MILALTMLIVGLYLFAGLLFVFYVFFFFVFVFVFVFLGVIFGQLLGLAFNRSTVSTSRLWFANMVSCVSY